MMPSTARCRSAPTLILLCFAFLSSKLCSVSSEESAHGDIFVPIDPDDAYWQKEIPFEPVWLEQVGIKTSDGELPLSHLKPPDFIDVYDFALPVVSSESSTLNKTCSETEEGCTAPPSASSEPRPSTNSMASSSAAAASINPNMPSPFQIGEAARQTVDTSLAKTNTSGVLLRNMHRIKTAEDFAEFWRGCTSYPSATSSSPSAMSSLTGRGICDENYDDDAVEGSSDGECKPSSDEGWKPSERFPGPHEFVRDKVSGIDIVGSYFDPSKLLWLHNENVYQPVPMAKFGMFCLQDAAWGGESLLATNAAITESISKEVIDYVKDHGGVRYHRIFGDRNHKRTPEGRGWQDRFKVETQDEMVQVLQREGFDKDDIIFDRKGTVRLINTLPGFRHDTKIDTDVWFSQLHNGSRKATLGDGSSLPNDMFQQLQFDMWKAATVLKVNPGDFLILNNHEVMHGRLAFGDTDEIKRYLLSVHTK